MRLVVLIGVNFPVSSVDSIGISYAVLVGKSEADL